MSAYQVAGFQCTEAAMKRVAVLMGNLRSANT
jgi:hypothetical protein